VPALTDLAKIKTITLGEVRIQALTEADAVVIAALETVDLLVKEEIFGTRTELAQRYLAAHFIAQSLTEAEGRGALSSETIGGISQTWTMPNLNDKSAIGSTQYGLRYKEIRASVLVPARMIPPAF
jgi:hypothetical protein